MSKPKRCAALRSLVRNRMLLPQLKPSEKKVYSIAPPTPIVHFCSPVVDGSPICRRRIDTCAPHALGVCLEIVLLDRAEHRVPEWPVEAEISRHWWHPGA